MLHFTPHLQHLQGFSSWSVCHRRLITWLTRPHSILSFLIIRLTFSCQSSLCLFNMVSEALCWILLNTVTPISASSPQDSSQDPPQDNFVSVKAKSPWCLLLSLLGHLNFTVSVILQCHSFIYGWGRAIYGETVWSVHL